MVEQATENRCLSGSIPLGTIIMKSKFLNSLVFLIFLSSCDFGKKDYFPFSVGTKWLYTITITSSYTGKDYEKRLMVTNVSSEQKGDITQVSKLHSDGSYYTYEINKKKNQVIRSSVILAFAEGMVEPIKKTIYPDLNSKMVDY